MGGIATTYFQSSKHSHAKKSTIWQQTDLGRAPTLCTRVMHLSLFHFTLFLFSRDIGTYLKEIKTTLIFRGQHRMWKMGVSNDYLTPPRARACRNFLTRYIWISFYFIHIHLCDPVKILARGLQQKFITSKREIVPRWCIRLTNFKSLALLFIACIRYSSC